MTGPPAAERPDDVHRCLVEAISRIERRSGGAVGFAPAAHDLDHERNRS